tara:strand:- start:982 stop:3066 length:2085 start_codon:yes stop_codon:yes gene_type:complete
MNYEDKPKGDKKAEKLRAVHETAMAEFDLSASQGQEERDLALGDRFFYSVSGAQWDGKIGEQFANRPQLENNQIHLSVIRIQNEYRNNRITAKFVSRTGDEGDELADLCAGLYRADQQDSIAEEAYDNAFEEGVGGGFGAWRLITEYEDEYDPDDDRQRIRMEPIFEADSTVYFDVNAQRQDKADAKHCFVLTATTREAYEDEWGEVPDSVERRVSREEFDWYGVDLVYVAEYYRVEEAKEKIILFRSVAGITSRIPESELDDETRQKMNDVGTIEVGSKTIKVRKIRKYTVSGSRVLEDCGYIAGTEIPIVPFYGKRWFVGGKERFMGHVRLAKDMQRLQNMQISVLAEQAASGGEDTPIVTPEQIAGHENTWANKAIDRPAYLPLNPVTDSNGNEVPSGPVGMAMAPQVPPAMAALLQISNEGLSDLLGNQQGGEQIQSNISGMAVELIQSRLDMQAYIYLSNFAKAVRRSGYIWLGMARALYDEDDRKMKVIDAQDEVDFVNIGREVMGDDGRVVKESDMKKAKFDVAVEIGPASSTKRSAIVRQLTEIADAVLDPADNKVITAMILRNMEGEGLGPMHNYFRKQLVQMGVEEPTEEDLKEQQEAQQQTPPDPNAQFLESEAAKNQAQAVKYQADTGKAIADTEYTKARTAETLAGIDQDERKLAIEAANALGSALGTAGPISETNGTAPR